MERRGGGRRGSRTWGMEVNGIKEVGVGRVHYGGDMGKQEGGKWVGMSGRKGVGRWEWRGAGAGRGQEARAA